MVTLDFGIKKRVWFGGFYSSSFLPLLPGLGKQKEAFSYPFQMSPLRRAVLTPPSLFNAHFTIEAGPRTVIPPSLCLPSLFRRYRASVELQMTGKIYIKTISYKGKLREILWKEKSNHGLYTANEFGHWITQQMSLTRVIQWHKLTSSFRYIQLILLCNLAFLHMAFYLMFNRDQWVKEST